MERSKCCQATLTYDMSCRPPLTTCNNCNKECEVIKSERTASDRAQTKEDELLNKMWLHTYSIYAIDNGLVTAKLCTQLAFEYASQKDAQIQALTKEVDGLKGHIEHLESQIFTLESTEVDQISQLKISGNKMAEALRVSKEIVESNGYKWLSDESQQALEEWEKLNK